MQFSEQEVQKIIKSHISGPSIVKALELRMCAFNPEWAFQVNVNYNNFTYDVVMRPEAKALWFQTWCSEQGHVGQLECQTEKIEVIGDKLIVVANAKVFIDMQLVSSDVASRVEMLSNPAGLDSAVQMAASYAKSRALSNAGFGACCSKYDIPFEPDNTGVPAGDAPLPFTMPAGSWDQPSVPAPLPQQYANGPMPGSAYNAVPNGIPNGAPNGMPQGYQCGMPGMGGSYPNPGYGQQPAVQSQPANGMAPVTQDPVIAAKAMVWTGSGENQGKTLGEILATQPNLIIWMAGKAKDASLKKAAQMLLPEANAACGK